MQAGGRDRFRDAPTRPIGTSDSRFPSLFDVSRETSRAATHVDAYDEVLSDAGSTPAASTTSKLLKISDLIGRVFSVYLKLEADAMKAWPGSPDSPRRRASSTVRSRTGAP